MSNKIKTLQENIKRLKNKDITISFSVPDTQGAPKGDVIQAYLLAKILESEGYKVAMLYEKKDYARVGSWVGEVYDQLPHYVMGDPTFKISASDILIIPEAYGHIVEQTVGLPLNRVVLVQDYENMLNAYLPGRSWTTYGVTETLTVSDAAAELIKPIVHSPNVQVVSPIIDNDTFFRKQGLKIPQVAIHSRNNVKTIKLMKEFHLKYPALKWVTFRDIHGIPYYQLNNELNTSIVSVWINHESTFGTFPLESLKAGTPVIGLVPTRLPEWYSDTEDSIVWTYDESEIVDYLAKYVRGWLEDNLPAEFETVGKAFVGKYNETATKVELLTAIDAIIERRITQLTARLENEINHTEEN